MNVDSEEDYRTLSLLSQDYMKLRLGRDMFLEKEYPEAYLIFSELAERNNVPAKYHVGIMQLDGLGVTEDVPEGLKVLADVCLNFDPEIATEESWEYFHLSCCQLGVAFEKGLVDGQANDQVGIQWWLLGAETKPSSRSWCEYPEKSNALASCQVKLAKCYAKCLEWEQSYYWYREAANAGNLEAASQVGLLCWYGLGCQPNEENVQRYLGAAAENGYLSAMGNLSAFYLEIGSPEAANYWAEKVTSYTGTEPALVRMALSTIVSLERPGETEEKLQKSISLAFHVLAQLHMDSEELSAKFADLAVELSEQATAEEIFKPQETMPPRCSVTL